MLKKSLIAIALLAIALPAVAGDLKVHKPWPTKYVPQEITTIDVVMEVGYYIHVKDQKSIKVSQDTSASDPYKTYKGCKNTDIVSNFDAKVSGSVAAASAAGGSWSAKFDGGSSVTIAPGTTNVQICVYGKKVDIGSLGGQAGKEVKVAVLHIMVVPAS
jgi:hypothetical protein